MLLLGITAGAAMLRLWDINTIPVGLYFDVAANLLDVLEIREGHWAFWFARNNGREPMMLYAEALVSLATGPNVLAAKLTAAGFGIASIPAFYLLGREYSGHSDDGLARRVGLVAAAIGAFLFWHVNFSRIGLRTIALPLFVTLGLALAARAHRKSNPALAALSGAAFGLSLYTYSAARLTPLVIIAACGVPVLSASLSARGHAFRRFGLSCAMFAIVASPLLLYYVKHPDVVGGRASAVSVLNPDIGRGDPLAASLDGLVTTLASIVSAGTSSAMENLPGRPLLDPIIAIAFFIGLGVLALRVARLDWTAVILPSTLLVMALPSALAVNPPGFSRISGMVPAVIAIAAIGLERLSSRTAPMVLVVALTGSGAFTTFDYFSRWAPSDDVYRAMMQDKVEGARQIAEWRNAGDRVFLAPLYARDLTYQFLLRDAGVESFDVGAATVIPAAPSVVRYAFPPEDDIGMATIARRLVSGYERGWVTDPTGRRPLLAILTTRAGFATGTPLASFGDGIDLAAVRMGAHGRRGESIPVALTWLARAQPRGAYTVFMHFRNSVGETRFQRDRVPGDGSAPTHGWLPGDLIIDAIDVHVPSELPVGHYRAVIGLYDAISGQRVTLEQSVGDNEFTIGVVAVDP